MSDLRIINNKPLFIRPDKAAYKISEIKSPSGINSGAVYTSWNNHRLPDLRTKDDVTLTLVHINDDHGKSKALMKIKTAIDKIQKKFKSTDLIKIHSGDFNMSRDEKKINLQTSLLNLLGINFSVLGNHEIGVGPKNIAKSLLNANFNILGSNLLLPEGCGLDKINKTKKITESKIFETNGHKYGLIGISPPDLKKRMESNLLAGLDVLSEEKTIEKVKEEVVKLTQKGINKIILVSHAGINFDKKIAKSMDGIDLILGGHSHTLLDPLVEEKEESIVYTKAGHPVLILQNGKNADFFGVNDITFDKNGIIKNAIARQEETNDFDVDKQAVELENKITTKSPKIGLIDNNYSDNNVKTKENAIANFVADSMRLETQADVALFPSFSLRSSFEAGEITRRNVEEAIPASGLSVIKITGQDITDALTHGAKSFIRPNKRPGIMQVSAIKYTISPNADAVDVQVLNNDKYEPIKPDKLYKVAVDSVLVEGLEDFETIKNPKEIIIKDNITCAEAVIKNIQKKNMPITMKLDDRINIQITNPDSKIPKAIIIDTVKQKLPEALKQMGSIYLKEPYKSKWTPENPTLGYSYTIAEVLYHYCLPKQDYNPMLIKLDNNETQWFLQNRHNGYILDLAINESSNKNPFLKTSYNKAESCKFLTEEPSKRAQILAKMLGLEKK